MIFDHHAPFILAAYSLALVVIGGLALASWRAHAAARAEVARLEAQGPRRR
jgi:heme exporter protein CcmD